MSAMIDQQAPAASTAGTSPESGPAPGLLDHPLHWRWALVLLAVLVAVPPVAQALDETFYIGLASRILIFALAATSLNLILGFGGLVSFGHAAFLGIGAYTVGILMHHGVSSGWVAWPLAVVMAPLPPSSAAMRSSSTALVGLLMRL